MSMDIPECRLCGALADQQFVRAKHVYGGTSQHKFWECKKCEGVYLWPVPSPDEEVKFYANEFEKFMSDRSAKDRDWTGAEKHILTNQDNVNRRWLFLQDDIKPGCRVLEIGCSSGFMLDAFKNAGMLPVGIEPSLRFLDFIKERGHKDYQSLDELREQQTNSFDLIVHFFVLEHIRDTKNFLHQQIELLKPGGKIIAEVPCVNDPLTSLYNIPAFEKFYWSIAHHYYFKPRSLAPILDRLHCRYRFVPEQRYDLGNHIVWMTEGKPRGQGRFLDIFSQEFFDQYKNQLKASWHCDTFFVYIEKQ